jgi:hypothetical protein
MNLKIFSELGVNSLRQDLDLPNGLDRYLNGEDPFSTYPSLTSLLRAKTEVPALTGEVDGDCEDAIKVYEFLGSLSRMEASDSRLWTYLSHVTFLDYSRRRWPVTPVSDNEEELIKCKRAIHEHWFTSSDSRSLRRHSIARLWWPIHLTIAPWKRDPNQYGKLEDEDPYKYARILMGPGRQDLYQNSMERGLGRSEQVLLAVLSFVDENPAFQKRSGWRPLLKELNLLLSYRKIVSLEFSKVSEIIKELAENLEAEEAQEV